MGHIAIFRDDFESFDRLSIANYIIEEDWPVFLNPGFINSVEPREIERRTKVAHSLAWIRSCWPSKPCERQPWKTLLGPWCQHRILVVCKYRGYVKEL
jgi:hypothetical protein